MKNLIVLAALAGVAATSLHAEPGVPPVIYGFQAEQFEYRFGEDDSETLVWDFDAMVGDDDLRFVFRSEAEMDTDSGDFETLENQLRLQMPISTFYDAAFGIHASTPSEGPERYNLVAGVKGLAPQWFEIDADLYLSEHPFGRFEAEYETLLTNRVILTPSIEINLPFQDDIEALQAAGGATVELGARLSYDLIDRTVSPYVGINYEKSFAGTADLIEAAGEESDNFSVVVGTRLFF